MKYIFPVSRRRDFPGILSDGKLKRLAYFPSKNGLILAITYASFDIKSAAYFLCNKTYPNVSIAVTVKFADTSITKAFTFSKTCTFGY